MTHHINRRTFLRLTGGAVGVGLAGCTTAGNTDGPTATPTDTASSPTATSEQTVSPTQTSGTDTGQIEVTMITDNKGSYFDPKGLLIEAGTTVRFVNVSGSHATTAYHPDYNDKPLRIPRDANPWDSGIFTEPDKTFDVTFEEPGVYDYYCPPHEILGMVGRIVVDEPQDGPGTTEPTEIPPGAQEDLPSIDTVLEEEVVPGP